MNVPETDWRYQPQPPVPPQRRRTPSFSSSLLDSILRSIDDEPNNNGGSHEEQQRQQYSYCDDNLLFFSKPPIRCSKIHIPQTGLMYEEERQIPSLRRAIMIDQWMETDDLNNNNYYVSRKSSRKFSYDSSSSGATTFTTPSSPGTETPSTHRSLPNSFTISRKTLEAADQTTTMREMKFMKSTKLRAMKLYGDLKKAKQPISPGSRISTFLNSIFNSSKKAKIEETIQKFGTLKKSRSIKQDTTTCSSFSRSCLRQKPRNNGVKRCVRFYPEDSPVIIDRKSVRERDPSLMPLPKYERKWFEEKSYEVRSHHKHNHKKKMKNYEKMFVDYGDDKDDDEDDEDDLFELEIIGGVGIATYREELPVFETTDLRKIRS